MCLILGTVIIIQFHHAAQATGNPVQNEVSAALFRLHSSSQKLNTPDDAQVCLNMLLAVEQGMGALVYKVHRGPPTSTITSGSSGATPSNSAATDQPLTVGPFTAESRKRPSNTKITGTCSKHGNTRKGVLQGLMTAHTVSTILDEHGYANPSAMVQRRQPPPEDDAVVSSRPPPDAKVVGTCWKAHFIEYKGVRDKHTHSFPFSHS